MSVTIITTISFASNLFLAFHRLLFHIHNSTINNACNFILLKNLKMIVKRSKRRSLKALGPGQTINVWRPNTIKHCLVTKHATAEVSGQTVKTCLIKHRSNNWYKLLSKCGAHDRFKHVWYAAVQTNKKLPIKHENKRNVLSCFINVWWPSNCIKHDQTRSNTYKHDQTAPNKVSKR